MKISTDATTSSDALFSVGTNPLTEHEAEALTERAFGLRARATLLTSERDQNFLLTAMSNADSASVAGDQFVLKITHAAESHAVTDFQTRAQLRLMQTVPALPVPHLISTTGTRSPVYWLEGSDGSSRAVRLNTFVPGRPFHTLQRDATICATLGNALARFDAALVGFHHGAASHELLWDLQHAAKLRPLLKHITDDDRRELATRYLDLFETDVMPRLPTLRRQIIHNDLNPYNVFVNDDGSVGGIIDFGDMVEAPLINELAVACSYLLGSGTEPLTLAAACIGAYHAVVPLTRQELTLLPDLIATRLLLTVVITTWRAALHPENRPYILRNNPLSWAGLTTLDALPAGAATTFFLRACGM